MVKTKFCPQDSPTFFMFPQVFPSYVSQASLNFSSFPKFSKVPQVFSSFVLLMISLTSIEKEENGLTNSKRQKRKEEKGVTNAKRQK